MEDNIKNDLREKTSSALTNDGSGLFEDGQNNSSGSSKGNGLEKRGKSGQGKAKDMKGAAADADLFIHKDAVQYKFKSCAKIVICGKTGSGDS